MARTIIRSAKKQKIRRWYTRVDFRPYHDDDGLIDPVVMVSLCKKAVAKLMRRARAKKVDINKSLWGARYRYREELDTDDTGRPIWGPIQFKNFKLGTHVELINSVIILADINMGGLESLGSKRRSILIMVIYVYPDIRPASSEDEDESIEQPGPARDKHGRFKKKDAPERPAPVRDEHGRFKKKDAPERPAPVRDEHGRFKGKRQRDDKGRFKPEPKRTPPSRDDKGRFIRQKG